MRFLAVGVLVVTCSCGAPDPRGATGSPAREVSSVAEARPASSAPRSDPTACLPRASSGNPLAAFEVRGNVATLCVYADVNYMTEGPCVAIDLSSKAVRSAPDWKGSSASAPRVPSRSDGVRATYRKDSVEVCPAAGACSMIRPGFSHDARSGHGTDGGDTLLGDVSVDAKQLLLLHPKASGEVDAEVFDVAKGTRIYRTRIGKATGERPFVDASNDWGARWLGKWVLLTDHVCCGPAGAAYLFEPIGGALKLLGDPAFVQHAEDDLWLVGFYDHRLAVVHGDTGVVDEALRVPGTQTKGSPEANELFAARLADQRFAIAHANPAGLVIVAPKKGAITDKMTIPICP